MPPLDVIKRHAYDRSSFNTYTTSTSISKFLWHTIIALAAIALIVAGVWFIKSTRAQLREDASREYIILESEVSIEFGDDGVEIEYDEDGPEGRHSFETILGGEAPHRIAVEIDKLRAVRVNTRKNGGLLQRRGKKTLILRPSDHIDADMAIIQVEDGRLTLSPFSSKKEPSKAQTELPARRRTPKFPDSGVETCGSTPSTAGTTGTATAPLQSQRNWRKADSPVPGHGSN